MRILFSSTPALGHIFPLLPLARAFAERGDDVAVLTAGAMVPVLAAESIPVVPAGITLEVASGEVIQRFGINPLDDGMPPELEAEVFAGVLVDFGADEALKAVSAWKPDLIVNEYFDFVGPLAAAALDIPVAGLAFGPAHQPEHAARLADAFSRRLTDRGLAPHPSRWYLDTCPSALQIDGWHAPEGHIGLRPEAHRAPNQLPTALSDRTDRTRPRVLVTFGTIFSSPQALNPLLHELAKADLDLIATTGPVAKPDDFDVDPARVTLVEFTPLAGLLHDVDLVITHGGAGSTLGALAAGIPMVVLPQIADQLIQAERVAAAGAGIALPAEQADPAAVAKAAATVLEQSSYRDAARKIAEQIAALPSPQDVAAQLTAALQQA